MRDRLIVGINNQEIQSKLIQQSDDLSLKRAIEIVRSSPKDSTEKPSIKKEDYDEDVLPTIDRKLQVQVGIVDGDDSKPDVKISEEAKIAILIELTNYKSILVASSGHENKKAKLWEQVYRSAQTIPGASFKSALHLREVFATWKNSAFQSRQQNSEEDVKLSNSDKLIWDLMAGQEKENLDDFSNLASNINENIHEKVQYQDFEDFGCDENHLNSASESNNEESCDDTIEDTLEAKASTVKR